MPRHDRLFPTLPILCLISLSGACIEPDYSKITVLCPAESPQCPSGMTCISGVCRPESSTDGGTTTDGPAGDLAGADMATANLCPQGRDVVFGNARGCPGSFSRGKASSQCPSGWAPCQNAAKVDLPTCKASGAFFAAAVSGYWLGMPSSESCGAAAGNQILFGCGTLGRSSTAQCGGLPRVIDVAGAWSTTDGTLATAALSDATQGVLCCPP